MIITPRLPVAIAVIALIGTGFLSTTLTAKAQQDEPKRQHFMPSPEDRAAFLDARVAALHAGLELTPDQDKLWSPVEQALRDFGKLVAAERQKFHDEKHPLDPVARLRLHSDNMIARGQALKKVADAAGPLYAALSDAQKRRLPILLHAIHPHFMRGHGMMGEGGHGMMGGHMRGGDDQDGGDGSNGEDKD